MMLANGSAAGACPKAPPPPPFEFKFKPLRLSEFAAFGFEGAAAVLLGANGSLEAAVVADG